MKTKYTLGNISKTIVRNIVLIAVLTILFGIAGGFYAKHKQVTTYSNKRDLLVERTYTGATANEEVQADLSLAKTYETILESNNVASTARKQLPKKIQKKYSADDIASMTNAVSIPQSLVLEVKVKADSAKDATLITNAVAEASKSELKELAPSAGTVKLFAKARVSDAESKTTPSAKKYALAAAAAGLLIGMVVAFSISTWKHLI